ncbi:MAG: ABC transporter permease [Candidatus Krumholzibacteriota bacterium]|nr:ABC transporter permease [Candidatus Krumholzibacteriota bacterium]
MKFNQFRYIIDESVGMLRRRMAANLIAVVIMGLSLLILAAFLLVTLNISGVIEKTSKETRVFIYLEDGTGEEVSREIYSRGMGIEEVEEVVFISRDEALANFRQALGEESDLLDALEGNPLPDAYRLKLKPGYIRSKVMERIAAQAAEWPGVEEVRYGRKWFERGEKLVRGFYIVDLALGLIVFLSVIFVISNTVRLTILNRRRAIDIMKLVGATNAYIQVPFIIEGALQGMVSSLLAGVLLFTLFQVAGRYIPGLVFIRTDAVSGFVVFCAALGALGSFSAMRRHLKL